MTREQRPPDVATIRSVLETLATFPLADPKVVCIEDVSPGAIAGTLTAPSRK